MLVFVFGRASFSHSLSRLPHEFHTRAITSRNGISWDIGGKGGYITASPHTQQLSNLRTWTRKVGLGKKLLHSFSHPIRGSFRTPPTILPSLPVPANGTPFDRPRQTRRGRNPYLSTPTVSPRWDSWCSCATNLPNANLVPYPPRGPLTTQFNAKFNAPNAGSRVLQYSILIKIHSCRPKNPSKIPPICKVDSKPFIGRVIEVPLVRSNFFSHFLQPRSPCI